MHTTKRYPADHCIDQQDVLFLRILLFVECSDSIIETFGEKVKTFLCSDAFFSVQRFFTAGAHLFACQKRGGELYANEYDFISEDLL